MKLAQRITIPVGALIGTPGGWEGLAGRIRVLAITAAMGRWEEFELHIRTGLLADPDDPEAAPLDVETIEEVLLQTAVYAGVPAGNTGMAIALKVLKELGRTPPPAAFGEQAKP